MTVQVRFIHPRANWDHVGTIPDMLSEHNSESATVQLHAGYGHGGGWNPFIGFKLNPDDSIKYPGEPALKPIAEMKLRNERILVYEYAWVAVIQSDRSFEICRMD
jgi:hypothetical protein